VYTKRRERFFEGQAHRGPMQPISRWCILLHHSCL